MGAKAFEQAAGFLRIPEGKNFLDNTGVHPESYKVTEQLLAEIAAGPAVSNEELLTKLSSVNIPEMAEKLGLGQETLTDIINDLKNLVVIYVIALMHRFFVKMSCLLEIYKLVSNLKVWSVMLLILVPLLISELKMTAWHTFLI